jgi:hypothetical protein
MIGQPDQSTNTFPGVQKKFDISSSSHNKAV